MSSTTRNCACVGCGGELFCRLPLFEDSNVRVCLSAAELNHGSDEKKNLPEELVVLLIVVVVVGEATDEPDSVGRIGVAGSPPLLLIGMGPDEPGVLSFLS